MCLQNELIKAQQICILIFIYPVLNLTCRRGDARTGLFDERSKVNLPVSEEHRSNSIARNVLDCDIAFRGEGLGNGEESLQGRREKENGGGADLVKFGRLIADLVKPVVRPVTELSYIQV